MAEKNIVQFRTSDGEDRLLQVELTTESGISYPIVLGATPFISEMDSNETIYEPIKASTGTLSLVSYSEKIGRYWYHRMYEELFTPKAQGTKVELKEVVEDDTYPDARIADYGYNLLNYIQTNGYGCDTGYLLNDDEYLHLKFCSEDTYYMTSNNIAGNNGTYNIQYDQQTSTSGKYAWGFKLGFSSKNTYIERSKLGNYEINGEDVDLKITAPSSVTINDTYTFSLKGNAVQTATNSFCIGSLTADGKGVPMKIYEFAVNDEKWYPVEKNGIYGLFCPALNKFAYNSGFTSDSAVIPKSSNKVLWTGYATPTTFNQDFVTNKDSFDVECIDGIGSLQYIKYSDLLGEDGTKKIISFYDLLVNLIRKCNCYKYLYIPQNMTSADKKSQQTFIENFLISECNFFDEKEEGETDKDVAWTCWDVLTEVCRFLNLSCFPMGDEVYLVDYDYVFLNTPIYNKYDLENNTIEQVQKGKTIQLTQGYYASSNYQVSTNQPYNKITVVSNFNVNDYSLPDIFDEETVENITASGLTDIDYSKCVKSQPTANLLYTKLRESVFEGENKLEFLKYIDARLVWQKYYRNKNWIFPIYPLDNDNIQRYNTYGTLDSGGTVGDETYSALSFETLSSTIGAYPMAQCVSEAVTDEHPSSDAKAEELANEEDANTNTLNFDNTIVIPFQGLHIESAHDGFTDANGYVSEYQNYKGRKVLLMENIVESNDEFFVNGKNNYLVVKGNVKATGYYPQFADMCDKYDHNNADKRNVYGDRCYFLAELTCGDYYFNQYYSKNADGTWKSNWQKTQCYFKIPFGKPSDKTKASEWMTQSHEIINNVNWRNGIDEEGFAINLENLPFDTTGNFKLKIYNPTNPFVPNSDGNYNNYVMCWLLTDFSTEIVTVSEDESEEDDTEYSLVIDDDYVNELEEIDFKINTFDNKKPNFSSVAMYNTNTGKYEWLDKTYNYALSKDTLLVNSGIYDLENEKCDGALRQESWLVYKLYKQYKEPTITYSGTFKNINDLANPNTLVDIGLFRQGRYSKRFIVDSFAVDYKANEANINFVQKK